MTCCHHCERLDSRCDCCHGCADCCRCGDPVAPPVAGRMRDVASSLYWLMVLCVLAWLVLGCALSLTGH